MDSDSDTEAPGLSDLCFLCEKPFTKKDQVTPGSAALETIKCCCKVGGDGKCSQLLGKYTVVVHRDCRKEYTKPSSVQKEKRLSEEIKKKKNFITPVKCLRSGGPFNFKTAFFFFFCKKIFHGKKVKMKKFIKLLTLLFMEKFIS